MHRLKSRPEFCYRGVLAAPETDASHGTQIAHAQRFRSFSKPKCAVQCTHACCSLCARMDRPKNCGRTALGTQMRGMQSIHSTCAAAASVSRLPNHEAKVQPVLPSEPPLAARPASRTHQLGSQRLAAPLRRDRCTSAPLVTSQPAPDTHRRTKVTCRRAEVKRGGSDACWA